MLFLSYPIVLDLSVKKIPYTSLGSSDNSILFLLKYLLELFLNIGGVISYDSDPV